MTFFSTVEEVKSTRRKFNISVPVAFVRETWTAVIADIQKTAEVRGFRKGKAPQALIRKFYLSEIIKKAVDRVIKEAYAEVIKTSNLPIVGYPDIEPLNQFDENQDFQFAATVDVNPPVEITSYGDIAVTFADHLKIDLHQEFEKALNTYARAFGKKEKDLSDSPLQKGDLALVSTRVFFENKEIVERQAKHKWIELNGSSLPALEEALLSLKVGEEKNFSITYPDTFHDELLKGKSVELQCTLHAKEKLIPAPWDEQLAKRLGYKSVEDAHAGIRATLMKSYEETRALHAFDQVVDHVLAHNQFEIPESLVENAIDRALAEANASAQKKKVKSDDQQLRDQYREIATKQVQGILALGHIARQEKISVTDDEMFHEMAAFAVSQQKDPRQFISKEGAKMYDEFRGQIMIRKAINRLLDMGKIQYISEKSNSA